MFKYIDRANMFILLCKPYKLHLKTTLMQLNKRVYTEFLFAPCIIYINCMQNYQVLRLWKKVVNMTMMRIMKRKKNCWNISHVVSSRVTSA